MNCFIPCRKKGDKIDNLNFLELDGKKLVEYSIIAAQETKLFKKIFIISDDKVNAKKLTKKYPGLEFIYAKKTNKGFDKMLSDLDFKKKILTHTVCVMLPNYPFKSVQSIKKMYSNYTKNNLSLLVSASKQNRPIYKKNKKIVIRAVDKIKSKNLPTSFINLSGGIFFYKSKFLKLNFDRFNLDQLFLLNEHEALGIYSLYDFIKVSSLFNIDSSIINKLIGYRVKV